METALDNIPEKLEVFESVNLDATEGNNCRFCWCDGTTKENPLVTPCKCIGSVKFIHIECL
jgi:E3 ubiquitin-protein ligase DOA10